MATKMENIIQHALRCFTRHNKALPETLPNDFVVLKNLVDEVTVKDVNLLKYVLYRSEEECKSKKPKSKIEPVEYLRLHENVDVSIGVFILKPGAKLPIHDHPCMYGILKVLRGVIKLTNYSVIGTDAATSVDSKFVYPHALKVIKDPETIMGEKDNSSTLTPTERGIHEVECVSGPAAFLDILAPPYDEDSPFTPRGCHYFKEVENTTDDGYLRLIQISDPIYWISPDEEDN